MPYLVSFSDSEVSAISAGEFRSVVQFSAVSAKRITDGVQGYLAGLVMEIELAEKACIPSDCFGRLREGGLVSGGVRKRELEIPFSSEQSFEVELSFSNGAEFSCKATSIVFSIEPTYRFTESSHC